MSDEVILYTAYAVVFLMLIIIGVAMWIEGKKGR